MLTVDDVLDALRYKGWWYAWDEHSVKLFHGICPVCLFRTLSIYDGFEAVKLGCRNHCDELDILAAFSEGLNNVTVDEALVLAESALFTAERYRDLALGCAS
jgi:hypothetical protein